MVLTLRQTQYDTNNLAGNLQRQKLTREEFDSDAYLAANQDVRDSGMDAWTHYDLHGSKEAHRRWAPEGATVFTPPPRPKDINPSSPPPRDTTPIAPAQPPSGPPADAGSGSNPPRPTVPASPTGPRAGAPGAFQRRAFNVPPPPEPPQPPPVAPDFMSLANAGAAPDFAALGSVATPTRAAGYRPTTAAPAAQDFMGMTSGVTPTRGAGYTPTAAPTAAPDFLGIAGQIGAAERGPTYRSAEGSWQGEEAMPGLESFRDDWMKTPNRYTTPWMESVLARIRGETDIARREGKASIDELISGRGLVGSDIEVGERADFEADLDQNRLAQLAELQESMAMVEAQDRAAAGGFGLNVGEFARGLGNDRREEGQYGWEADTTTSRNLDSDRRFRTDTNLAAAGQTEGANQFRAGFAQDENQFGAEFGRLRDVDYQSDLEDLAELRLRAAGETEDANQFRTQFGEDQNRFAYETDYTAGRDFRQDEEDLAEMRMRAGELTDRSATTRAGLRLQAGAAADGATMDRANHSLDTYRAKDQSTIDRSRLELDSEEVDLRAFEIHEDSRRRGEEMTMAQAQAEARNQLERERMSQDESQFGRAQAQQASQFGQDLAARREEAEAMRKRTEFLENVEIYRLLKDGIEKDSTSNDKSSFSAGENGLPRGSTGARARGGDGKIYEWRNGRWYPPNS